MRGFINVCKPSGMTSSDVVVKVRGMLRRACGERIKVGHTGTLDPMGTGVLPIAVGTATKLFDYLLDKSKIYIATFRFGASTDTLDSSGTVVESTENLPTLLQIEQTLKSFIGEYDQMPPQYSAKSVDGVRAYDLARKGIEVKLQPKRVRIEGFDVLSDSDAIKHSPYVQQQGLEKDEYAFAIRCGGGTYIRSLARDLADRVGSLAYMTSIHRVQSGGFAIETAISLDDINTAPLDYIQPIDTALANMPKYVLKETDAFKVLNGVKISCEIDDTSTIVVNYKDQIIGIAAIEQGQLHIKTRL